MIITIPSPIGYENQKGLKIAAVIFCDSVTSHFVKLHRSGLLTLGMSRQLSDSGERRAFKSLKCVLKKRHVPTENYQSSNRVQGDVLGSATPTCNKTSPLQKRKQGIIYSVSDGKLCVSSANHQTHFDNLHTVSKANISDNVRTLFETGRLSIKSLSRYDKCDIGNYFRCY